MSVCGSSGFSDSVRDIVLKTMNEYRDVEFVETEFRPGGRPVHPSYHATEKDDLASGTVKSAQSKNQTSSPGKIKTFRQNFKSSVSDDTQHLVKAHSHLDVNAKTLDEAELEDLEEGLPKVPNVGVRKVRVKEII